MGRENNFKIRYRRDKNALRTFLKNDYEYKMS